MNTEDDINRVCNATRDLLLKKNRAYGDSALTPISIFGTGNPIVSIGARMDDKLARLKTLGVGAQTIDTLYDLHGYLTLLLIAIERENGVDSTTEIFMDDSNTTQIIKSNEKVGSAGNDVPIGIQNRKAISHHAIEGTQSDTGWSEFRDDNISTTR